MGTIRPILPRPDPPMTTLAHHWLRKLAATGKPAYQGIADLIAEDVRSGRLSARDRLPPLRELAAALGLNYTTVARAYAEARKRGLIDSRPGMGTVIRGAAPSLPLRGGSGAEMAMNLPPEPRAPELVARLKESAAAICGRADLYELLRYQDFGGTAPDREAAAGWLRAWLPGCPPERVLVSPGIHSVLTALVSHLAQPGELICVESLVYPGIKAIAAQLGVKLHAVELDEDGPRPAAFEAVCRNLQPRAFYCNPTLRNPDTGTMTRACRAAIADVALRYNVPIIEDDAYGMLPRQAPAPLAVLAPEITYYITGFSKFFGAGLRTGFVVAPSVRQAQRLAGTLRALSVMASPITNAIVIQAIQDGTAAAMLAAVREESQARQALAARMLQRHDYRAHPDGFHLWLPIPRSWSTVEFASYLRAQGVAVVASAAFSTDSNPPDAVRVCLGGSMNRDECEAALALIADTLDHPQHPHATVV